MHPHSVISDVAICVGTKEDGECMTYLSTYKCPLCKGEFSNPNELREHRLTKHKSVFQIIKAAI